MHAGRQGADGQLLWLQAEAAPEAEAASGHRSTGKLRRAIAASALASPQASAQPLQDVELDAAKQESVGALVRRYVGELLTCRESQTGTHLHTRRLASMHASYNTPTAPS